MDRLSNILQTPFPDVSELHVWWTLVTDQVSRKLREQDLPTMPGRHDPLGHCDGGIAGIAWRSGWILQLRRARVNSHADSDGRRRPGFSNQGALNLQCRFERLARV